MVSRDRILIPPSLIATLVFRIVTDYRTTTLRRTCVPLSILCLSPKHDTILILYVRVQFYRRTILSMDNVEYCVGYA